MNPLPDQCVVPIEVLLVEDDPGDVLMTREAFEEHKVRNNLSVVVRRRGRAGVRTPRGRRTPTHPGRI